MSDNSGGCSGSSSQHVAWDTCCSASCVADFVTESLVLIDSRLKIVSANAAFMAMCGSAASGNVVGYTMGEVLKCRHAASGRDCAPANDGCLRCGWYLAIQASRAIGIGEQDFRILTEQGAAYDFAVKVSPVQTVSAGGALWMCALKDTYAQKRLRALERSFFHDVTNLAVGIRGVVELLNESGEDSESLQEMLHDNAIKLVGEIDRLRTLRVAENGDVRVWYNAVSPEDLLRAVVKRYQEEADARRLDVEILAEKLSVPFEMDQELFVLVLGELWLNAVEASGRGAKVSMGYTCENGEIVFRVSNPAVMDPNVRVHIFERSFTTKGAGRGLGLYRAKLIAERYLKGSIGFSSNEPEGTVFCVSFPLAASEAKV